MNVKQLIEKYKKLEGVWDAEGAELARQIFLQDLKQLDEPQKVVVPKFVADWYEENKDDFEFNVWDWIAFRNEPEKLENKEFSYWINDGEGNPIQTLVNMHQFGYEVEVEKEKRYIVKLKNNTKEVDYLVDTANNGFRFYNTIYTNHRAHTRKELEDAGFGWVFDCEGIEIEEVE
ncbi:DUF1642 domain-containing protein [Streptococcus peroris]|uniref:DUF1642 domain-containing protein n=1 Tax=Streptococcus peroris TaxID=68891 RepID=UPI0039C29065